MKIFVALSLLTLLILLIQNKIRPSILFGGLATIYYVLGYLDIKDYLHGYTNTSLIVLVLLLLTSIAIEKTSFIHLCANLMIKQNYKTTLFRLGIITPIISAFLNNTAVVASFMGIIKNNKNHPPSKLLIPLSYFSIVGGTMTLIGTSTNLIVNSFVIQYNFPPLKLFDFAPVGILLSLTVLIVLIIFSFLLPQHTQTQEKFHNHLFGAIVLPHSSLIGKTIQENKLRALEYLFLVEIKRGLHTITPVGHNEIIQAGDELIFSGDIAHISILQSFNGLQLKEDISSKDLKLIDAIVSPDSELIGQKIKNSNFRTKFNAAIIALQRGSQYIPKIGDTIIKAGDRLILAIGDDFSNKQELKKNFYILSNISPHHPITKIQNLLIILGFITAITLATLEVFSLLKSLIILLSFLLIFKIIKFGEIKNRFPWDIFIIVGSSLAITKVLTNSGLAQDLANSIIFVFGHFGMYGSFIGIYLLTLFLTEIITNNAAAALALPIAFATAMGLEVNPTPFILAVAYGASASFMMPYGYQTNLMVSAVGKYTTKDFLKIGWIISLCYSLIVIIGIPIFFDF